MPDPNSGLFDLLAAQPALFVGCCLVLGLLIGSFLNVVIYRVPIMMNNELRAECAALSVDNKALHDMAVENVAAVFGVKAIHTQILSKPFLDEVASFVTQFLQISK